MTSLTTLRREGTHETLGDLAAALTQMQKTKLDYVVDTRRMSFPVGEGVASLSFDTAHDVVTGPLSDHANNQIAQRLAIPKKYYDRMLADAPILLTQNVEHWFHHDPERRLVRMLDGNVRAFLSDRYRRLDNFDLVEKAVIPALQNIDGLSFHVANLTPERLVLRAILPSVQRELGFKVGDVVQAGFQIRNSEVGASSLAIEQFVWKLDCLNGMVSNVGNMKAYHVGRRIADDDAMLVFADETLQADDRAFWLKARDMIRQAVSEANFDLVVDAMRKAHDPSIEVVSPVGATEQLAQAFNLTETEGETVLASLARGGDLTRWGVVNAVTDAAKKASSFDRQEEMERIGGELLTIGDRDWSKIALARVA
jgi:hypothetical protein